MSPIVPNHQTDSAFVSRTEDSRFHPQDHRSAQHIFFKMYSRNIASEADGMAYSELNILRSLFLEPLIVLAVSCSSVIGYGSVKEHLRPKWVTLMAFIWLTMLSHLLRIVSNILILLIELTVWPIRVFLGVLLSPYTERLSAGYLYALGYETFVQSGCTTRRIKVNNLVPCRIRTVPACCFGKVLWFQTENYCDAFRIVSLLKLQQRCGTGPECILLDGMNVFVSWWRPWNITRLVRRNETAWNLYDVYGMKWRRMVFEMTHDGQSDTDMTSNNIDQPFDGFSEKPIKFLSKYNKSDVTIGKTEGSQGVPPILPIFSYLGYPGTFRFNNSDVTCGEISTIYELEQYYNSPLGWNKYHKMKKEGNKIRVLRSDRRAMSHLLALFSSLSLYIWYKDSSQGRFGLFIDLQALIVANYAFITAYAGEILLGAYSEVVDAKSDRYGIIVTRAIDQGFVRGFYVPNGDWLIYTNGAEGREVHEITKTEVNATCNSIVKEVDNGMKIRVIGYDDKELCTLDWVGSNR